MSKHKKRLDSIEPQNMNHIELLNIITYCDSWRNPYGEELCKRTGNIIAYVNNPEKATKAAAEGFGYEII